MAFLPAIATAVGASASITVSGGGEAAALIGDVVPHAIGVVIDRLQPGCGQALPHFGALHGAPDLTIVGGHIGWPWTNEMVALATKYPNVYIDTSAYKPSRYPAGLVDYMRGRGRKKVLFGTNFPMLTAQACLDEVPALKDLKHDIGGMVGDDLTAGLPADAVNGKIIATRAGAYAGDSAEIYKKLATDAGQDPAATYAPQAYDAAFLLALAIGTVGGNFYQNIKELDAYEAALDAGRLPIEKGLQPTAEDRLRRAVISRIAPPVVLRPNKVPCGPLSTAT